LNCAGAATPHGGGLGLLLGTPYGVRSVVKAIVLADVAVLLVRFASVAEHGYAYESMGRPGGPRA
jgi:hypothetical protein